MSGIIGHLIGSIVGIILYAISPILCLVIMIPLIIWLTMKSPETKSNKIVTKSNKSILDRILDAIDEDDN